MKSIQIVALLAVLASAAPSEKRIFRTKLEKVLELSFTLQISKPQLAKVIDNTATSLVYKYGSPDEARTAVGSLPVVNFMNAQVRGRKA
jgi:hypothetical protein